MTRKEWSRFNAAVLRMKHIAQHAGFVALNRNVLTDDYVTLYDGRLAGFDTDGGRWSLVCEIHSTVISHTTKALARRHLNGDPTAWCEDCRKLSDSHPVHSH